MLPYIGKLTGLDMAHSPLMDSDVWSCRLILVPLLLLLVLFSFQFSVFCFLFALLWLLSGRSHRQQLMLRVNAHFRFLRQTLMPHSSHTPTLLLLSTVTHSILLHITFALTYSTTTFWAVCQKANCLTGSCAKNFTAYLHLTRAYGKLEKALNLRRSVAATSNYAK